MLFRVSRPLTCLCYYSLLFFLFSHPSSPESYTLSLHDALPISQDFIVSADSEQMRQARESFDVVLDTVDRKSTRLNSSHVAISYAIFCLKKNSTLHPSDYARQHFSTPLSGSQQLSRLVHVS